MEAEEGTGRITILNEVQNGDVFRYRLVRLVAKVEGNAKTIDVVQSSLVNVKKVKTWPIVQNYFKALVLLDIGENDISLILSDGHCEKIQLIYNPLFVEGENPVPYVRLVYLISKDDDGHFQAPEGTTNDLQSAIKRIQVGGLLMQSFCADEMLWHGFDRRTFALDLDDSLMPKVTVFRSELTREQIYQLGDNWKSDHDAYSHFYSELKSLPNRSRTIDCAIMSMSHHQLDPETKKPILKAHTALGSASLGLFGGACLHTWAESIDEIPKSFTNSTHIRSVKDSSGNDLFDDSCNRSSFWSIYSTTLGACMHEIGHCFGLPHTYTGVMSRGFDFFNRSFCITEEGFDGVCIRHSKRFVNKKLFEGDTDGEEGACWARPSSVFLRYSKYFINFHGSNGVVGDDAEFESVKRNAKKVWVSMDGNTCFWHYDGNDKDWFESKYPDMENIVFKFKLVKFEKSISEWRMVELLDESRGMQFKIDVDKGFWKSAESENWNFIYHGAWVDYEEKENNKNSVLLKKNIIHNIERNNCVSWKRTDFGGIFKLISRKKGIWAEISKEDKILFTFREVLSPDSSSPTSVIIYDASRGMYVKMEADKAFWSQNPLHWNWIYEGSWDDSDILVVDVDDVGEEAEIEDGLVWVDEENENENEKNAETDHKEKADKQNVYDKKVILKSLKWPLIFVEFRNDQGNVFWWEEFNVSDKILQKNIDLPLLKQKWIERKDLLKNSKKKKPEETCDELFVRVADCKGNSGCHKVAWQI